MGEVRTGGVALIGLGEVGRTLAEDLAAAGVGPVTAWDTGFAQPGHRAGTNAEELGLAPTRAATEAVAGADLVVCAVTAAQCVAAAEAAAPGLAPGAWYLDLNSSSPGHKRTAAEAVDGAGGRYVEVALMAPIAPRRLQSPFLLGGPHAEAFAVEAAGYGLADVTVVSDTVGRAAATKLCRSVIIKGLEALMAESLVAARRFGVEADVLGSLSNLLPEADWEAIAGYMIGRSLEHGTRRAEEMEEAAATVTEAGVEPLMAEATVRRQRWAAGRADARRPTTTATLDALLESSADTDHDDTTGAQRA